MYHYTECGLQNVWLRNGYTQHKTKYGPGTAIHDVDGLNKAIGRALANRPHLTGAELRFLRKELELSQAALANLMGTSEQNVSLWERRGRIPKLADRMVKLIYIEHSGGNVKVREMIERLNHLDKKSGKLSFEEHHGDWQEAA